MLGYRKPINTLHSSIGMKSRRKMMEHIYSGWPSSNTRWLLRIDVIIMHYGCLDVIVARLPKICEEDVTIAS